MPIRNLKRWQQPGMPTCGRTLVCRAPPVSCAPSWSSLLSRCSLPGPACWCVRHQDMQIWRDTCRCTHSPTPGLVLNTYLLQVNVKRVFVGLDLLHQGLLQKLDLKMRKERDEEAGPGSLLSLEKSLLFNFKLGALQFYHEIYINTDVFFFLFTPPLNSSMFSILLYMAKVTLLFSWPTWSVPE